MNKSILFIDESGKSSLIENANEPFILTGVILEEEEIIKIEGFFNYIKRRFGINLDLPFHSYHIYENANTKLNDSKLYDLSKTLSEFIAIIPAKVKIILVDKLLFKEALGITDDSQMKDSKERKEKKEFPYRIMSTILFEWFGKYLNDSDRIGQILTDARRGGDAQLLKTLYLLKEGTNSFNTEYSHFIKQRLQAICFAEKGFLSGGIEITDLISYVTYLHARKLITLNSSKGIYKLWSSIKTKIDLKKLTQQEIKNFFGIVP